MARIPSPITTRKPRLEIIPFIDVMFFLLATFMMVSLTMVQNQGIDLNLPGAKSSVSREPKDKDVIISVQKDGDVFYNKEKISCEALAERLLKLKEIAPEAKVILQGDSGAEFQKVIEVLDEARHAGLTKLVVRTRKM
jgi:biopolymer transport protein ExbD